MKKLLLLLMCTVFGTTILTACVNAKQESNVVDYENSDEIVVSTSVALTEILDALGLQVAGVPTSSYELPESTKDAVKVGNPMSPDLEIIKSLRPTCVVAVDTLGSDYMALFEQNNIPSEFVSLESLEGLKESIYTLGERFNVAEKATELVAQINVKEDGIRSEVEGLSSPEILILFAAPGSTMIATAHSYIGNLVEIVGGHNIIEETASSFVTLNKEYIAMLNPNQILVMTHALPEETKAALEKEMASDASWQNIEAVRERRVVYLDSHYFGMSAN
ncbi:MAG TPA: heme ABC transporter substrate-binding protein IsdE, partial [Firmicutes bacterium]|nr:heme ABC transporter substrate-binding protein IsdE [Bacillota bacterium]